MDNKKEIKILKVQLDHTSDTARKVIRHIADSEPEDIDLEEAKEYKDSLINKRRDIIKDINDLSNEDL